MNLYTYHLQDHSKEVLNHQNNLVNQNFKVNLNKKIFQADFKNSFTPIKKIINSNFSSNKKSISNNASFTSEYNKNLNSNQTTLNPIDISLNKTKNLINYSPSTKFKIKHGSSKTSIKSLSTQLTNSSNNKGTLSQRSLNNYNNNYNNINAINLTPLKDKNFVQVKSTNISREHGENNYESHIDRVISNHKWLTDKINNERQENLKIKLEKLESLQRKRDMEMDNFKLNQLEKSKILKIKRKIKSIVNNEAKDLCHKFEFLENYSNGKIENYMKSDKFKMNLKKYHKIFRLGNNDPTSNMLNPEKYAVDFDLLRQNKDLEKNDLFKNRFSPEELEMIRLDPEFYIGNKSFFKEVPVLKQTNLMQKLEKEEIEFKQLQERKKKKIRRLRSLSMGVEILETQQTNNDIIKNTNHNLSTNNLFQNYQKNKNVSKSKNVSLVFDSSSTDIKTFKSHDDNHNQDIPKINLKQKPITNHSRKASLDSIIQSYRISAKKYLNESIVKSNIEEYINNKIRKKELNEILTQKTLKEAFWKSKIMSDKICSNFVLNRSVNLEKNKCINNINFK